MTPRHAAPAESLRLPSRRAATVAVLLWGLLGQGCSEPPPATMQVHARIMDLAHARSAAVSGSTAAYPTASLRGERRPILRDDKAATSRGNTHGSATVTLPERARLEVGYGLEAGDAASGEVGFTITTRRGDDTRKVLEREISVQSEDANVWHDVALDLSGLTGDVVLEFATHGAETRGAGEASTNNPGGVAAYFSEPIVTAPASEKPPPLNVLLISIDTLRADHLGIYGYERDTSPSIDRIFSSEGLVVERFYTNAVDTIRGHASMLTGHLPTTALAPGERGLRLAPFLLTMAERLRAHGYRTAAFSDEGLDASAGLARGFDRYREASEAGSEPGGAALSQAFERALGWTRSLSGEPFFVFLHTYRAHAPYDPPAEFRQHFPVDANADEGAADRAAYDAEIRQVDAAVGKLLDALRESGVLDRTLVVLTSDHGEGFGEHGRRYHGTALHDEALRVPLLLRAPGLLAAGARRSGPMQLADLVRTLCSMLAIDVPEHVEGQNFAAHLTDNAPTDPVAIYHEARAPVAFTYDGRDASWIAPALAVTTWPRRLIRIPTSDGARYELYDLMADPGETNDIYPQHKRRIGFLRARLDGYEQFRSRLRENLRRQLSAAGSEATPAKP